ncbi:MAG: phosphate acyltransferase PlsX [Phycisphaerales bacterium]|nr:phosphate acyltransferase PlsX [Phycisphaerales bacterium]
MRIGLDVMGGDLAPDPILEGGFDALSLLDADDRLVFFGDEAVMQAGMQSAGIDDHRIELVHSTELIGMDESPVEAVRTKNDSSMVQLCRMASRKAGDQRLDAVISAGNTGAFVAAAQMHMRRLPNVSRPGIAAVMPTFGGPVVFMDVGANIDPKPSHLHQYGIMGSIYARDLLGIENPRVALMNVGGEEAKGTEQLKAARDLLRDTEHINFIGYVEGRAVFDGAADVVITDGVTGNVVIKLSEGLSSGIFRMIKREIDGIDPSLAGQFEPIVRKLYAAYDYHEYGGAPLLGVNGLCLICHGSSQARTITNAIRRAHMYVNARVNESISDLVGAVEVES